MSTNWLSCYACWKLALQYPTNYDTILDEPKQQFSPTMMHYWKANRRHEWKSVECSCDKTAFNSLDIHLTRNNSPNTVLMRELSYKSCGKSFLVEIEITRCTLFESARTQQSEMGIKTVQMWFDVYYNLHSELERSRKCENEWNGSENFLIKALVYKFNNIPNFFISFSSHAG